MPTVARTMGRLALVSAVFTLLLVMQSTAPHANAIAAVQGDVNCSGTANADDSLQLIRSVAELPASTECAAETGDVNCDDAIDAADSLRILRYVHDNHEALGCTPKNVAERLYAATNANDVNALLMSKVYPVLDIGVYTGDGAQILDGAETDIDTDFYLYDFESELLAGNLARQQLYGLQTLTLFLTEAGLQNDNEPLTEADVLALLSANAAASRSDESMFAWRLIDELGLAQDPALDLTDASLDVPDIQLDSVQVFLMLHDLASPLFAANVQSAAGGNIVDLPTKALHDWAARNVVVTALPVDSTRLRPTVGSTAETRTVTATVSFPSNDDLVVLSGPLTGYDPSDFLTGVGGFPVWWFPEATLVPANGVLVNRATSEFTSDLGEAKVDFLPNVECPNAKGAPVAATHQILVEIQPLIKSIFPPHTTIGLMSVMATTHIEVSRRSGGPSGLAAGTPSSSITSLDQLPCEWTVAASGTTEFHPYSQYTETGTIAGTFKFRLAEIDTQFQVATYEIVPGAMVTWHAEGSWFNCDFSIGGTDPAHTANRLLIARSITGEMTYGGVISHTGDRAICGPCDGCPIVDTVNIFIGDCGSASTGGPWLVPAASGVAATCHSDANGTTYDFSWQLYAGPCPPAALSVTPQGGGTCGGAASFRRTITTSE